MTIEEKFHALEEVVVEAGKEARAYFESDVNPNTQKEDGSVVTEVDQSIEKTLRAFINQHFPDDAIIGEEEGNKEGVTGYVWYIDPIDGTDNFVRKIPFFAVTAARLGPEPEGSFAIIHNPVSGQVFSSFMERGSYENGNICNLTAETIGGKYFITVTGSSAYASWVKPAKTKLLSALYKQFGKSGHLFSALLEYAYVAAGRLDASLNLHLQSWDSAAGLYLVKAAGGAISVWRGTYWERYDGPVKELYGPTGTERIAVFVSHPDIHDEILDFIGDPKSWAEK